MDKALAGMPDVTAEKEWHAFLLDWNAPQGGECPSISMASCGWI
jgi:predicted DsbA family dithiol-disulfide isomerase